MVASGSIVGVCPSLPAYLPLRLLHSFCGLDQDEGDREEIWKGDCSANTLEGWRNGGGTWFQERFGMLPCSLRDHRPDQGTGLHQAGEIAENQ